MGRVLCFCRLSLAGAVVSARRTGETKLFDMALVSSVCEEEGRCERPALLATCEMGKPSKVGLGRAGQAPRSVYYGISSGFTPLGSSVLLFIQSHFPGPRWAPRPTYTRNQEPSQAFCGWPHKEEAKVLTVLSLATGWWLSGARQHVLPALSANPQGS